MIIDSIKYKMVIIEELVDLKDANDFLEYQMIILRKNYSTKFRNDVVQKKFFN